MLTTRWSALPKLDRVLEGMTFGVGSPFDVESKDDRVVFSCDLPGVKPDDVDITLDRGVLSVKAKRALSGERAEGYRAYAFATALPEGADGDGVHADLSDGVLRIEVPTRPKPRPKRIGIGRGGAHEEQLSSDEAKNAGES